MAALLGSTLADHGARLDDHDARLTALENAGPPGPDEWERVISHARRERPGTWSGGVQYERGQYNG
jgi:hypothetical protein